MTSPAVTFDPMQLQMIAVTTETAEVISIDLGLPDGGKLPPWQPGAHLDFGLPSGRVRQYSLCGDPSERSRYRIAVRRQDDGRGGSAELHGLARPGAGIEIRGLRNHFPLGDSQKYLFIAGGIGISPILPMILDAERRSRPWVLIYGGRSLGSMAFSKLVSGRHGGYTRLVPSDQKGRIDFEPIVATLEPQATIYACGPSGMLDAIQLIAAETGRADQVHIERFSAPSATANEPQAAFDVELRRSRLTLHVPADRSLADVLKEAGAPVTFSCEEGCCGLCETGVLAGTPLHRDCVLSDAERVMGDRMMVCVGRSSSPTLVLDL